MEEDGLKNSAVPLLRTSSQHGIGTATALETLGNIIVSVVGTGILGLPFAFSVAGWLAGTIGVTISGIATCYCMLLLVQCKEYLASQELTQETKTYGDLGYKSCGNLGRYLTEFLVFMSQCGGAVAYLVFIAQNLSSLYTSHTLTFAAFIFLLVPVQIALSWITSLSALAPFSIFANVCNVLAVAIVVKEDVGEMRAGGFNISDRKAIASSMRGLPFAAGMAVFCFEGFGMTLSLEGSMREKGRFPSLLAKVFTGITIVYVLFGFSGYMAYGDQTRDIITLNLPQNWSSIPLKIALCLGLIFTFPIMAHPIHEIVEGKLKNCARFRKFYYSNGGSATISGKCIIYLGRATLILALAFLASFVPGFGVFASLVGSTVCALLSFVLPATFHLRLLGSCMHFWQRALDYCFLIGGLLFAAYGSYNAVVGVET
ncbi:hypothetical protein Tsubulata_027192 [Turnera subulata]|uniref:Amino acid transporter transmembrane domain-containing protein n=1 Tax=Turnera subulata TaxID=218843 RepID=A0A9Q0FPI1_9ROSI|nr:hypothetical protein Tsubulata_027192 [Turnera subulata]